MQGNAERRQGFAQLVDLGQQEALPDGGHLVLLPLRGADDEQSRDLASLALPIGAGVAQGRIVDQTQIATKPDEFHDPLSSSPAVPCGCGSASAADRVGDQACSASQAGS
ncbi:hypothetical protein D3C85_1413440 [compost metagenome]